MIVTAQNIDKYHVQRKNMQRCGSRHWWANDLEHC